MRVSGLSGRDMISGSEDTLHVLYETVYKPIPDCSKRSSE